MTTDRQLAANRANALHSTGPRTQNGKAIVARNPIRHGLLSSVPVISGVESPAAWERHRASTLERLAPADHLEEALAERAALILWRLARVARYERLVTTDAPDDLAGGYDARQVEKTRAAQAARLHPPHDPPVGSGLQPSTASGPGLPRHLQPQAPGAHNLDSCEADPIPEPSPSSQPPDRAGISAARSLA